MTRVEGGNNKGKPPSLREIKGNLRKPAIMDQAESLREKADSHKADYPSPTGRQTVGNKKRGKQEHWAGTRIAKTNKPKDFDAAN